MLLSVPAGTVMNQMMNADQLTALLSGAGGGNTAALLQSLGNAGMAPSSAAPPPGAVPPASAAPFPSSTASQPTPPGPSADMLRNFLQHQHQQEEQQRLLLLGMMQRGGGFPNANAPGANFVDPQLAMLLQQKQLQSLAGLGGGSAGTLNGLGGYFGNNALTGLGGFGTGGGMPNQQLEALALARLLQSQAANPAMSSDAGTAGLLSSMMNGMAGMTPAGGAASANGNAVMGQAPSAASEALPLPADRRRKGRTGTFPQKLHQMLSDLERQEGGSSIASFLPHGRAFAIHKPREFVKHVMPKYFRMSRFSSFQRQLNLYDFQRITEGPDKGCYFHELFVSGRPILSTMMKRNKIKGVKNNKGSNAGAAAGKKTSNASNGHKEDEGEDQDVEEEEV